MSDNLTQKNTSLQLLHPVGVLEFTVVDGAPHLALLYVVDEAGNVDKGHMQVKDVGTHVEPHRAERTLSAGTGLHSGHGLHPQDALYVLCISRLRGLNCSSHLLWDLWLRW